MQRKNSTEIKQRSSLPALQKYQWCVLTLGQKTTAIKQSWLVAGLLLNTNYLC